MGPWDDSGFDHNRIHAREYSEAWRVKTWITWRFGWKWDCVVSVPIIFSFSLETIKLRSKCFYTPTQLSFYYDSVTCKMFWRNVFHKLQKSGMTKHFFLTYVAHIIIISFSEFIPHLIKYWKGNVRVGDFGRWWRRWCRFWCHVDMFLRNVGVQWRVYTSPTPRTN